MRIAASLAWIVGSALIIPGTLLKVYEHVFCAPKPLPHYMCRVIATGPQKGVLSASYLAELMQLSADRPTLAKEFDASSAEEKILASPVIKECRVKKVLPDTAYVDYTVRKPIALFHDFENAALDEEGVVFPIAPFLSPKKLPQVYLGVSTVRWGEKLEGERVGLALQLLKTLEQNTITPKRLDVSKAFATSLGQREIVVILEEKGVSKFLRLTPKNFWQEMGNYLQLSSELPLKTQTIDLRVEQLAFIEDKREN